MKTEEVQVGKVYGVKIRGSVVPIRIDRETSRTARAGSDIYTGRGKYTEKAAWIGTNLLTNREIHIRSAAKLRWELSREQDFPCGTCPYCLDNSGTCRKMSWLPVRTNCSECGNPLPAAYRQGKRITRHLVCPSKDTNEQARNSTSA